MPTTLPTQPIPLEINYSIKMELDTRAAEAAEPVWSDMGVCFNNITPALNEVLFQASYYADAGWGRTEITGGQMVTTMTGNVMPNDPVSDYLTDPTRMYKFGKSRHSFLRITRGTEQIIWAVTLANITMGMGEANQPNTLSVEVHGNGAPSIGTVA